MAKRILYKQTKNSYLYDRRTYLQNTKTSTPEVKSSDSLNQLMKNWIISNSKSGESIPIMKMKNTNSQDFIKFIKLLKTDRRIYENVNQILDSNYITWVGKARKVERLINTKRNLKASYDKLMSLYLKRENMYFKSSCNDDSNSCSMMVAILSLFGSV
tara:strand:+ start:1071 stop:1544 length:474 start_codon:yes stop_codon:yes gene_type:complete